MGKPDLRHDLLTALEIRQETTPKSLQDRIALDLNVIKALAAIRLNDLLTRSGDAAFGPRTLA
jgi:hypothetical protein